MAIIRWGTGFDPFRDLVDFADVVDDLFGLITDTTRIQRLYPAAAVSEKEGAYVLRIEIPGARKEDITVTVEENTLVVEGKREAANPEGATLHTSERAVGEFRRVFPFREAVDGEHITAEYRDGVLLITVPKVEVKARQILLT